MTLAEVLVSIVVFLLVTGAILSMVDTAAELAPKETERALAVREAQVGLERMSRELRQAYSVRGTTPSSMDVLVTVGTQNRHLIYDCGVAHPDDPSNPYDHEYRRCVRWEADVGDPDIQSQPGRVVIDRVLNATAAEGHVFDFSPSALSPTYVTARIEVPARGERIYGFPHRIVLSDGFYMRNLDLGETGA